MLLGTGQVPELATEPYRVLAHIMAEIATALVLLVSSYGLFRERKWATKMAGFAQGALFYTLIASPGYYLQLGITPIVVMFLLLEAVNLILFWRLPSTPTNGTR
jgi:hypothetical protein